MQDLKLLEKMEEHTREEIKNAKEEKAVLPPLKENELESNTLLRGLYNEAYYCTFAGLPHASVLLQNVLLERLRYLQTTNRKA